ncbi:MAG: hypothetical protein QOE28_594 [Solirubrobacteraceae bacterium]|nr:hypothetical protein [Solirubrobacteraceae bacterium]
MAFDATRTLRGALAGATAAAVWAAQQPLDKRVFGVDYDDVEFLGRLARVRPPATQPVGLALHLVNGAVAGAAYANLAPSLPGPPTARGVAAALAEHLATWPGTMLISRLDLGRGMPRLWGDPRAFAQATWRHALFGAVLGTLEGRLNPAATEPEPIDAVVVASNGHGSPEHLVATGQ